MDVADQILTFLKENGPSLPTHVAKRIRSNTLLASAHLSDLASRNKLKISALKVGASPLYFLQGQEELLFNFAKDNVKAKDYIVLEKLKAEGILRENDLDLLSKVAVRNLRDFAVPLQVRSKGVVEFFWKWHLLDPQSASEQISKFLDPKEEPVQEDVVEKEVIEEPIPEPEIISEPEVEVTVEPEPIVVEPEIPETVSEPESVSEIKKESEIKEKVEVKEEPKEDILEEKKEERQKKLAKPDKEERKTPLLKKLKDKISKRKKSVDDTFLPELENFFKSSEIVIDQKETVRKNSEMNFIIKVPTAVGPMLFFCKAKSKARCDEKDISSAYMESQIKKLPLLFLYTKDLNKKAQEMLKSDAFQNALVRKVE